MKDLNQKIVIALIYFVFSGVFFFLSFNGLGKIDSFTTEYFDKAIKKSAISYGVIRGVNSLVSVVKESNVDLTPAGVGVSIAVGEILDPLDDMTERVSSILVMAIVALGVEKISFEILGMFAFFLLGVFGIVLGITGLFKNKIAGLTHGFFLKLAIILVVLRVLLPLSAGASYYLHQALFVKKIEEARAVLLKVTQDNKSIDMEIEKEDRSFFKKITDGVKTVQEKTQEVKESFFYLKDNMSDIIQALITLVTVYIMSFLVDVIILPLVVFLIIFKGLNLYVRKI